MLLLALLGTGIGISPPARKLALWPVCATSVGLASTRARPLPSRKPSCAVIPAPLKALPKPSTRFIALAMADVPPDPEPVPEPDSDPDPPVPPPLPLPPPLLLPPLPLPGVNTPNWKPWLLGPPLCRFTPARRSAFFLNSTTCTSTCTVLLLTSICERSSRNAPLGAPALATATAWACAGRLDRRLSSNRRGLFTRTSQCCASPLAGQTTSVVWPGALGVSKSSGVPFAPGEALFRSRSTLTSSTLGSPTAIRATAAPWGSRCCLPTVNSSGVPRSPCASGLPGSARMASTAGVCAAAGCANAPRPAPIKLVIRWSLAACGCVVGVILLASCLGQCRLCCSRSLFNE
ncbi:hypothetical protein D3C72_1342260 [compost metagenome]